MKEEIPKPVTEEDLKKQDTPNEKKIRERISQSTIYASLVGSIVFLVLAIISWVSLIPSLGLTLNSIIKMQSHQKGKPFLIVVSVIDVVLIIVFIYTMLTVGTSN
ncbi:MAG: hypothetical protein IJ880_02105 [Bacilli bacterium]|nr:hypothetical protein [Bacilli bacterium]